jgi:hypothetical protein
LTERPAGFQARHDDGELPESTRAEAASGVVDPVQQKTAGTQLVTIPGLNFLGLGEGFIGPNGTHNPGGVPPDANAAVGATQVVETVNLTLAVFDKTTGTATLGPLFIGALWKSFNAACADGASLADPVVLYDKQAGRWVIKIGTLGTPYLSDAPRTLLLTTSRKPQVPRDASFPCRASPGATTGVSSRQS